ncbi:hypothetical protein [Methylobrevis albus]|uniref:NUDIX hydrolase n=1 Tax=Methylobrevis albus TaxID=2793297 RepID=A0A931I0H6_9HYPH|nr:hypothetical protein [Methylobrevis albus]MBH0236736.1 hypothetical protein [Methylobrevis albus]
MYLTEWTSPIGTPVSFTPIRDVAMRLVARGGWPVDPDLAARIERHWQGELARNPSLWNGRVLGTVAPGLPGGVRIEDGVFRADAVEFSFATHLAWRAWGYPDIGIRNVFGSAVIESADGALLFGLMGDWTSNPGRIYPPGGSLEPRDVAADGTVDLIGSIALELAEETGLAVGDAEVVETIAVFDGPRISVAQRLRFAESAEALVARIRADLVRQAHRELEDVVVVRGVADLDPARVPAYALAIAGRVLGG